MLNDVLKDNIVLIIPNNLKSKVLEFINQQNKIYNIKIMDINALIDILTFSYNNEAIYYLMEKYNFKYEVACLYLNNIRYINKKDYQNNKLIDLLKIKDELIENKLLIFNNNLIQYLKDREIIFYGYDYIDEFLKSLLNDYTYKVILKEYYNYPHEIYEFDDIDEEIEYVAIKICELIKSGIDINKIKLLNVTSEYFKPLERIFKMHNIPLSKVSKNSIYDTLIISDFIKNINDEDILEKIKEKYNLMDENNNYIYNKLINILNEYTFKDYKSLLPMLISEFKKTPNYCIKKQFEIEIIDIHDNIISSDNYVFLLGFNQENIPKIFKDEEYLNDKLKKDLGLKTSILKNKIEKEIWLNNIKSIKNLTITYKLKTPFNNYNISSLNEYLLYPIKKVHEINKFSKEMNKIKLSYKLDDLIKYGTNSSDLSSLYHSFKDINYLSFDNKFKGIKQEDLHEFLDKKITLSYSNLDNYSRCKFRYYLDNILKIGLNEETIALKIGNIFHDVLAKCFNADFDFESSFNEALTKFSFTKKEEFFIAKLKEELKFVIKTLKEQNRYNSLDKALYENTVYVNKEGTLKLTFKGIIDKLLYKQEDDKTYLVIIDYKTGTLNTNFNSAVYGINMQLPIYLYLAKNKKEFKNIEVVGFYLQKILNSVPHKEENKCEEDIKRDNLKLNGYSTDNPLVLEKFDSSYVDSNVIKSMKYGKNGFYAYSKTLSDKQIAKLIELVDDKINEAFKDITEADFKINPKQIGDEVIGCMHCKYKDICYMKEEDIVKLKEYKNLEFLD